jgi:phosphoglycolate/pyridoxal phosphate phosphatase family enzyme|mmetsp:Transcript_26558/g.25416  ORF Transcript_26558/g.25416 Transcript_26558/m.25416 type:complete len:355 (-) Transcript_26558:366-1430(-)|eukprot:CAMPEP_0119043118 /NCGR_PEP_ID=MMETSP1177-20130426/17850_1 /TAXON_ID=2985 /ORGANISM="Ochromonas sp, Strain CCMP1899" /LENGTH=354 /DNA_ID=CAMNT_0007010511 /DNA_START=59 /DNA_END=1123 /DNA_ORIENTATION=-
MIQSVFLSAVFLLSYQNVHGFSMIPHPVRSNRLSTLRATTISSTPSIQSSLPGDNSYDGIICDMDGVLWLGNEEIHNSIAALNALRNGGKSICFVTNNSAKTKVDIQNKLKALGYEATLTDIITSSSVTAEYVRDQLKSKMIASSKTKVFMIGNPALEYELERVGFEVLKISEHENPEIEEDEFSEISQDVSKDVKAVVVGIDYAFNYRKLAIGSMYLGHDSLFAATNPDAANKVASGSLLPEPGALIAALETVSGRKVTVCGKPSDIVVQYVLAHLNCDVSRVMMVGDRLDTDIAFGNKAGVASCLVLTGCTSAEEVAAQLANPVDVNKTPSFVAKDLWDMASPVVAATANKK